MKVICTINFQGVALEGKMHVNALQNFNTLFLTPLWEPTTKIKKLNENSQM